LPGVEIDIHEIQGAEQKLTEIYLVGDTSSLVEEDMEAVPCG